MTPKIAPSLGLEGVVRLQGRRGPEAHRAEVWVGFAALSAEQSLWGNRRGLGSEPA